MTTEVRHSLFNGCMTDQQQQQQQVARGLQHLAGSTCVEGRTLLRQVALR